LAKKHMVYSTPCLALESWRDVVRK